MSKRIGYLMACAASFAAAAIAESPCGADALGVSRTIEVSAETGRIEPLLADKEVVLTFDDGPDRYRTPEVLEVLASECVTATFFLLGREARGKSKLVRRIVEDGHTLGGHGYTHENMALMDHDDALKNAGRGLAAVERALNGRKPKGEPQEISFFRAPFLATTERLSSDIKANGIAEIGVTVDGKDWTGNSAEEIVETIMAGLDAGPGKGVILLHDPFDNAVLATRLLLNRLKAEGYSIVALAPAE
ncbi:MAG: polysaccharide deacetylase family protein [Pseudomonadota bacterium]